MSYPVNLQAMPGEVLQEVFTPENMRGRRSLSSLAQLTFPKSRSALWDGSPAGEKLRLQLCSHRKPRVVLLEKALRLAQRHARRCNKPRLQCFFLGSLSVNEDEEGITVTLDRFDPGRDQAGTADLVPSALLPGDVLVPCWFSPRSEAAADAVAQSEAELHRCFKALQQSVSGRQTLHLSQLLKVRGQVLCSQTSDAASFSLSWSAVCPAVGVDVQPVRAVPIIPTALLRSLTSVGRPAERAGCQRGFLTMDQTRKLVLLLESDPKASSLPLVGLWLSRVAHISNPQVWAWTLRFMFGAALQDRVLSEVGCFLLVVFASTHRTPQFFQCRESRPGPSPGLDFQLLTATQSLTLYQVAPVDGRALRCELDPEDHGRQAEVFRAAQSSFNGTAPPAAGLSVSDQDSGVEDEDFSPRPSPSPHPPAPQVRRVQPSVPELSLLIDSSFSSNHSGGSGSAHKAPPASPTGPGSTSSSAPAAPPHLHSTPNPDLQQPCSCCSSHAYSCTSIYPSPALPPAAAPHFHQQTPFGLRAAPPPSCSQQKTSPPLASFHHYAPRRPSTPPHQQTAPPLSRHSAPHPCAKRPATPPLPPASCHQQTPPLPPPSSLSSAPLQSSHKLTPPPSSRRSAPPFCSYKQTPPPSGLQSLSPSSHQPPAPPLPSFPPSSSHPSPPPPSSNHPVLQPPPPFLPPYPCSHAPPAPPWCGEPPSPHPSRPDPVSPPCGSRCCEKAGGGLPSDAYQFLLHQDHLLRLLQAQVQMLLEAQGKLQSSGRQVETQTSKSTASVGVETGASLFWGQNPDPSILQEERDPPPSPGSPPPSSSSGAASSRDPSAHRAQEADAARQTTPRPSSDPHSISGLQSPVLGESVSMYGPPEEQQSFYQNLMTQLNSRLQESDRNQEEAAEASGRQDRSGSDHSRVSQPSQRPASSSERRRAQRRKEKAAPEGDAVVRATLRRLQQLGVAVDAENLTVLDKEQIQAVEMASTLASINPAAVVSRLSVSEPAASGGSALFPGGSVDLSLEANAIALRYLSQSQLSRLSLGGHAPQSVPVPASSSGESLLSPSNMSLATRKYMRRYGLIEEDVEEEEDEEEEEVRQPLNVKLLPQSQLIRELRPKMQLLAGKAKPDPEDKENRPDRRTRAVRQPEASVGNILDLSRLRQLPKLF
ncbi:SCL-interrupting locus protein homolog [Fundulus diaphanus]